MCLSHKLGADAVREQHPFAERLKGVLVGKEFSN